jgi:hypothetical protein
MVRHLEHITFGFPCLLRAFNLVRSREPNNYPFVVQRGYIINTVILWDTPGKTLFDLTIEKLKEMMSRVIDTHFERHAHGNLKQRVL